MKNARKNVVLLPTSLPENPAPRQDLARALDAIKREARDRPEQYLRDALVPEGGE